MSWCGRMQASNVHGTETLGKSAVMVSEMVLWIEGQSRVLGGAAKEPPSPWSFTLKAASPPTPIPLAPSESPVALSPDPELCLQ